MTYVLQDVLGNIYTVRKNKKFTKREIRDIEKEIDKSLEQYQK